MSTNTCSFIDVVLAIDGLHDLDSRMSTVGNYYETRSQSLADVVEHVIQIKTNIVVLLLLEKDCSKFYPTHSLMYVQQLLARLNAYSSEIKQLFNSISQVPPENTTENDKKHSHFLECCHAFNGRLQEEISILQEALGYTCIPSSSDIPQIFIDADPDLVKRFSIESDGFEIV